MPVSSKMASIEDNSIGRRYGYRISKCALNAAGKSRTIDLNEDGSVLPWRKGINRYR